MHQGRPAWPKTKLQNLGAGTQLPAIAGDGNTVDSVDSFVYIGSVSPPTATAAQISTDISAGRRR